MRKLLLLSATVLGALPSRMVFAEQPMLEEITVTARKKSENVQSVPLSVTAIEGEDLQELGIRQPSDLQRTVPSLSAIPGDPAFPSGVMFDLRGLVGSVNLLTFSQPVGLYEDGVNIPHVPGNNAGFFDVERVEVVAGPQGTLYGRNTTGGAISVITRGAEYGNAHGFVYAEAGNLSDYKLAGATTFTLIPQELAVRLAYQHWSRDGFGQSSITGQRLGADHDDDIARLSVRFDPGTVFSAQLKLEYYQFRRADTLATLPQFANAGLAGLADAEYAAEGAQFGATPPSQLVNGDLFHNTQRSRVYDRLKAWHGVLDLHWALTDSLSLSSITGYHQFTQFRTWDASALPIQDLTVGIGEGGLQPYSPSYGTYPVPLRPDQQDKFWSEELNLAGSFFGGLLTAQFGVYGSWDSGDESQTLVNLPALAAAQVGFPFVVSFVTPAVTTDTRAVYTQGDVALAKDLSATLGVRYTRESLSDHTSAFVEDLTPGSGIFICYPSLTGPFPGSASCAAQQSETADGTSYLASLNWHVMPDMLLYLKTSRGFRGGALNPRDPGSAPIQPERATDYELGLKSDLWQRRVRLNGAVYDTEYKNKQELSAVGTVTQITNAADARVRGVEAQLQAVATQHLSIYASGSYTDGKYLTYLNASTDFGTVPDASGQAFPISKWHYDIGARYEWTVGTAVPALQADYAWHSAIPTTLLNDAVSAGLASASQQNSWREARGLLNARAELRLPDSGWMSGITLAVAATNLLNEHYQLQGQTIDVGVTSLTQEPRMWWASINKSFGKGE